MSSERHRRLAAGLGCAIGLAAGLARAEAGDPEQALAQEDRIAQLERTVSVLVDELERTRSDMAVPEDGKLESVFGMGPAASKIYSVARGLSIGGYGEGFYQNIVDDSGGAKSRADLLRMVLYAGYKFSERILFNAEIEFEHATTESTLSSEGGSVSVEFAALDFLLRDWANLRAGLLLLPVGFLNEIHEPPFYFGVNRPDVERRIIPSTWRENGAGLFGRIGETLEYKAYVVNGFNARGFAPGGLRGGRQNGSEALAEHLAFVGRVDWSPLPEWLVGGSLYHGSSGQDQVVDGIGIPDVPTTLWEVHSQLRTHGLHLRGLFTMAHLGDVGSLTSALLATEDLDPGEAVGGEMLGVYGEVAYEVLHCLFPGTERTLEPFFRFEYYDTQRHMPSGFMADRSKRIQVYTAGLSFEPIPNVVIKADYRNRVSEEGSLPDEVNLGVGFVF